MPEYMDYQDIATYTGLTVAAVRQRYYRGELPEPARKLGQSPVWTKAAVNKWCGGEGQAPARKPRSDVGKARK